MLSWSSSRRPREQTVSTVRAASSTGLDPAPTAPFGEVRGSDGRPLLPPTGVDDPVVLRLVLQRMRARDPHFDPDALAALAQRAVVVVEEAWSRLDPAPSRRYMADALWASHRARMELYALQHRRNVIDGLVVQHAAVVAAESAEGRDRVVVRVTASSTDYDVDSQTGAVVRGDRTPHHWAEDWVFERAGDAVTRDDGGVVADRCPHCGAPLDSLDEHGACGYCHAQVMDGHTDWVVVLVTGVGREEDYLRAVLGIRAGVGDPDMPGVPAPDVVVAAPTAPVADPVTVPGVAAIAAADPGFDPETLDALARSTIVAVSAALRAGDPAPAVPFLAPDLYARLSARIAGDIAAADAPAPLVDDVRLVAGSSTGGVDEVVAEAATADAPDLAGDAGADDTGGEARWRLVMRRLRDHPSDTCPRCGAPLSGSLFGVCDHCHAALAGGGTGWVVVSLEHAQAGTADDPPAAAPPPASALPPAAPADPLAGLAPPANPAEVLAMARTGFFTVEAAVCALDAGRAAGVLDADGAAAVAARVAVLSGEHRHRRLAFLDLLDARIVAAEPGSDADRVTVRLTISAADSLVDDAGAVVQGDGAVRSWDEDWVLSRRRPGDDWLVAVPGPG